MLQACRMGWDGWLKNQGQSDSSSKKELTHVGESRKEMLKVHIEDHTIGTRTRKLQKMLVTPKVSRNSWHISVSRSTDLPRA